MRSILGSMMMLIASLAVAQSPINVVRQNCIDSICRVKTSEGNGHGAVGTGCLVAPTWVLTADHVSEGFPAVVQFRQEQIQVVGRWRDSFADCAVLKLAHVPRTGKVATVARTEGSGVVCCVGFDNGDTTQLRLFEGVAEPSHHQNEIRIRPYNARMAEHGNSGGPVFNARGEVVSSLHSNSDLGNTYANSNAALWRFMERIRQRTGEQIINWASMAPNQFSGTSPPQWATPPASGQMPSQPFVMPIQNQPSQPLTLNPPLQSIPIQPTPQLNPPTIPIQPSQQIPVPIQGRFQLYLYPGQ